jgi:hypothetical protein
LRLQLSSRITDQELDMERLKQRFHTTNPRRAQRLWCELGGTIKAVRRTGEIRYTHSAFPTTIRANTRRSDVPAVVLCRINKLLMSRGQAQ